MEIDLESRLRLHGSVREALQQRITATLERWADTADRPRKVIVSRPAFDPGNTVAIEVRAASGKVLGSGQITPPDIYFKSLHGVALALPSFVVLE